MPKQIYIDSNGNEIPVSGTINTADILPISGSDQTDTKDYIDTGLSGKADSSNTYTKTEVGNLLSNSVYPKGNLASGADANNILTCGVYRVNGQTANFPNGYGTLVVFSPLNSITSCAQLFIRYDGKAAYYRIIWDNVNWSDWKQF